MDSDPKRALQLATPRAAPAVASAAGPAGESDLRPVLVLALDGASFDVIRPLVERGELPTLRRLLSAGQHALLPSTTPPVTFPAWSSFMTGLEPADHGIFDFTQKRPGQYALRFVNATHREAPSIFARVCQQGERVLVLGLPATHPPEPVDGLLVCGFDAPVSSGTDERSASDPALYRAIADRVGPWMRPELDESARADDFHERAVSTLLARIDRKRDFALEALRVLRERADGALPALTMVVFSESDTAGHHYARDHDPESPRHDPRASPTRRRALADVYRRLDAACGALCEAVGPETVCVVLSDHGMGPASDKVVHLNRFLVEAGLLVRRDGLGRHVDRGARLLRDTALAWLPASLAQRLFRHARPAAASLESRARFGGIDWRRTLAFSEEANTNPGVWINRADREAAGVVADHDYEAVRDRVIEELRRWRLPSGDPVVARACRREDVHRGRFTDRAPDIVIELALDRGYGLSLVPTPWAEGGVQGAGIPSVRQLGPSELAGGRGRGMNGTHRNAGIWIAVGPTLPPPPGGLVGVAPWLAATMGLAWPTAEPDRHGSEGDEARIACEHVEGDEARIDYDDAEEAMVAERLRALGYLE